MITYTGRRGTAHRIIVQKDGESFSPAPSQRVVNHSPDGFNWSYGGSGPAQLALALLLDVTDRNTALDHYQDFKRQFVAAWGDTWSITSDDILKWVRQVVVDPPQKKRVCRVCGCTQVQACNPPCYWVEPDLCSACTEKGT